MDLKERYILSYEIARYFWKNGMPQQAIGFRDDGAEKIIIITNRAVLPKKMAMKKVKRYAGVVRSIRGRVERPGLYHNGAPLRSCRRRLITDRRYERF